MSATATPPGQPTSDPAPVALHQGGTVQGPAPAQRPHLYVGNLSPRLTESMLQEIFSVAGAVQSVKIIGDRGFAPGGLNYGFIEYVDMRSAEAALQSLNGRNVFDQEIKVSWAKNAQQPGGQSPKAPHPKEDAAGHFHIFVGDLSPEVNDAALRQAFSCFASIVDARIMWDVNTGKSRGYGFISFRDRADAEQSIATMNGEWLGSRTIRVNWANQKTTASSRTGAGAAAGLGLGIGMGMGAGASAGMFKGPVVNAGNGGFGMFPGGMNPVLRMGLGMPAGAQPFVAPTMPLAAQPLTYEQILAATPPTVTTLYCGNLSPHAAQSDLVALLAPFGFITEVRMQRVRGYAFVKLDSHEHAANAIYALSANGCTLHNRPLKVSWGKERSETGSTTAVAASAVMRATQGYTNMMYFQNPAQAAYGSQGFPQPSLATVAQPH